MHEHYVETRPLYLETDACKVGFGAGLLQIRNQISCPKDEATCRNIERGALGILN